MMQLLAQSAGYLANRYNGIVSNTCVTNLIDTLWKSKHVVYYLIFQTSISDDYIGKADCMKARYFSTIIRLKNLIKFPG